MTFSAYAQLQPGEGVWLHLAHQGEEVLVVDHDDNGDDDDDVAWRCGYDNYLGMTYGFILLIIVDKDE